MCEFDRDCGRQQKRYLRFMFSGIDCERKNGDFARTIARFKTAVGKYELQSELQQSDFANSPYNVDIRKIRDGASVEELMRQSDLSYDEAALLIRLHGGKA